MIVFTYTDRNRQLQFVESSEDEELQLCSECSLPNRAAATCLRCGHPLGRGKKIRASDIVMCSCGRFLPNTADECPECGRTITLQEKPLRITFKNMSSGLVTNLSLRPEECVVIGRGKLLNDQLADCGSVSWAHLILERSGNNAYIEDISSCGTFINGERVPKGDTILLPPNALIGLAGPSLVSNETALFRVNNSFSEADN